MEIYRDWGFTGTLRTFTCPGECCGAYDINPAKLPTYDPDTAGIISAHWPNFLRYDPEENLERLDAWKAFFARQAEVFGLILSRDMVMAHHQLLYRNFAVITENNGQIQIDLTDIDKMLPPAPGEPLYISIRNTEQTPVCRGGILKVSEQHTQFTTYQITRTGESILILNDTQ